MKPSFIFILLAGAVLTGCKTPETKQPNTKTRISNPAAGRKINILVLPLKDIGNTSIAFLKTNIATWYNAGITVLPVSDMPLTAWHAPRKRYKADSILVFLKSLVPNTDTYVLGVTGKDISTNNGENPFWGVMGLGYQPGHCCIISNYRLRKHPQTEKQLNERLLKVALHELGHNFGLPHCPEIHCLMTDAKGKDKLNDEKGFCFKCQDYLHEGGFIK